MEEGIPSPRITYTRTISSWPYILERWSDGSASITSTDSNESVVIEPEHISALPALLTGKPLPEEEETTVS